MTQINLPLQLIKEVVKIMDNHPVYNSLGLDSKTAYVKEALKDFVKSNGDSYTKTLKSEADRIIYEITKSRD